MADGEMKNCREHCSLPWPYNKANVPRNSSPFSAPLLQGFKRSQTATDPLRLQGTSSGSELWGQPDTIRGAQWIPLVPTDHLFIQSDGILPSSSIAKFQAAV